MTYRVFVAKSVTLEHIINIITRGIPNEGALLDCIWRFDMTFMEEIAAAVEDYSNANPAPSREEAEAFLIEAGIIPDPTSPDEELHDDIDNVETIN